MDSSDHPDQEGNSGAEYNVGKMEEVADIFAEYVASRPATDLRTTNYTTRLSEGERAFVESLRDRLGTNKGETLRVIIYIAAMCLEDAGEKEREELLSSVDEANRQLAILHQRFDEVEKVSEQLDRIEDRLAALEQHGRAEEGGGSDQEPTAPDEEWGEAEMDETATGEYSDEAWATIESQEELGIEHPDPDEFE